MVRLSVVSVTEREGGKEYIEQVGELDQSVFLVVGSMNESGLGVKRWWE